MGYDNVDLVSDFARRTRENLKVIEALASTHLGKKPVPKVWEFTQLVNSLLGLLVFPQQEWFDKLPDTPLADMPEPCWQNIHIVTWERKHRRGPLKGVLKDRTFKELAICLRNSIAHFNVTFECDNRGEIKTIRLWNIPDENHPELRDFEIALDTVTLRHIAVTFIGQMTRPTQHKG